MKTKEITYSLICLLAGFSLLSCNLSSNKLPYSQGAVGNVLIVMNDDLWAGPYGDSIRHYFTEPIIGLPAPEPMFTLSQMNELSDYMLKFRNIFVFNIDPGYETAQLGYKNDVYAANQLIFNIYSPSADSAIACVQRNKDKISARFLLGDRNATIADYKKSIAREMIETLNEKFLIDIVIPKSYSLDVNKDDFVWIAREEGEKNWHILIWKEPYVRQSQLDTDSLIFAMNAMTRKNVPGPSAGSYMADEPTVPPEVKRFEKDGVYSIQLNGLWQTENSYMGGPYVNHTIVDIKRGQLITALGFVYYPNRDKRQMVRQLEAILYSMMPADGEKPVVAEKI